MEGTSIKIIDNSTLPEKPYSPNVKKYTAYGFVFGLFLGVAIAVLIELLDRTIKSEEDINAIYADIPVLGSIPEFIALNDSAEENSK
jgi:capsular polysaccharide biosynthesis protein